MRIRIMAVAVAALFVAMPAVSAHVTVQPAEADPGSFARFVVRVPNERDDAATTKVEVQMPEGLDVSYQPKAGWTRTVSGRTVTWEGGRIEPGEFDEFGFSTRMPEQATTLVFPAVQTYTSGEVVRWVGPADAEEPAGRVTVTASGTTGHGATEDEEEDHTSHVATILGAVGIVLGGAALFVALRRRA